MPATVAWFTGLSGSGKSAIADKVAETLRDQGHEVRVIDGDDIRGTAHRHLGFSPEDIRENNRLVALLCQDSLVDFDIILVPLISPFRDSREAARDVLGSAFVEVYVKASVQEVMRRDPKGYYKAIQEGKLTGFIGVDEHVPYEPPESAELVLDTETDSLQECASQLVGLLTSKATIR